MEILKNRSFFFILLGRIVTNIGDSIYYVAAMWLVYSLGGNAFYSGLAGFLTLLPAALRFLIGPFVDRWPIKRTLIITQVLQSILVLVIPIAYYSDVLTVQLVLIVMPIVSFIEQFAYPSQSKALPLLLTKQELVKGNALFSFAYQGIDLVFNAMSGILVAFIGAVTLYLVDSFTFAIAALFFSLIKIPSSKDKMVSNEKGLKNGLITYWVELKEGFSIVFGSIMGTFLIGSVVANFAIGGALAVLPAFADQNGGSGIYGFYLAAMSTGGLFGAILSSWMGKFLLGYFSIISFFCSALCWVLAAIIPWPSLGVILYGIAWIPIGGTNVIFASAVQTVIPNQLLGRVSSVSGSMGTMAMPIGSLAGGYLASVTNSTLIFALTGLGLLFVSTVWVLHPRLRTLPKANDLSPEVFGIDFEERLIESKYN
ncbi:MFS transporter [Paucisalibacillus sp. EB02]|uniref:MFS transporter n=1 Tax=Paucisalibacillus sp. EB02 TaxID=1347087 RepID=UPI0004B0F73C|nr:MFS transporter [Paucisalibacillus sp. EB02]